MLKCGLLTKESDDSCKLDIAVFNESDSWIEHELHESEIMAQFYCDTRGIVIIKSELDFNFLTSEVPKKFTETEARQHLSSHGYKL